MRRGETPGLSWFSLHSDPNIPQPNWSEIGCGGDKVLDQEWKAKYLLTNNHISTEQSTSSAMLYPLPTSRGHSAQCLLLPPGPGHVFICGHCLHQGAYRASQLHGNNKVYFQFTAIYTDNNNWAQRHIISIQFFSGNLVRGWYTIYKHEERTQNCIIFMDDLLYCLHAMPNGSTVKTFQ